MRISDWSSDVCSSDLRPCQVVEAPQPRTQFPAHAPSPADPRYPAQGGSRRGAVSGLCRCAVAGRPTLRPGNIVVLDDFSSHKSKAVRRAIGAAGAMLFFLPKYSPDLNPTEQLFACRNFFADAGYDQADRKSTRLNSSH